jgi:uncharacterized membrane protein YhaH (DUF805 family)
MKNWLLLFLSPYGQVGRRSFWHGWLVLTLVNVMLLSLGSRLTPLHGAQGMSLPLITLYPTVCLYAKRLHDLDKSGWLQAPSRAIWAVCLGAFLFKDRVDPTDPLAVVYVLSFPALLWDAVLLWWCASGHGALSEDPATVFE